MTYQQAIVKLQIQKVLPLFYHHDAEVCKGVIQALYNAGIRVIEFTNRGAAAEERFSEIVALRNQEMTDLVLAVGTVRSAKDVNNYLDAGADMLISPFWDDIVAASVREKGAIWLPGCMTPTEIQRAASAGIHLVKLFPGNVLGTSFIEAIKPLFPGMQYVVTGGIDASAASVNEWLNVGILAAGLGSKLIGKNVLENQRYDMLQQSVAGLLTELSISNRAAG